jgi:hypothetical protein
MTVGIGSSVEHIPHLTATHDWPRIRFFLGNTITNHPRKHCKPPIPFIPSDPFLFLDTYEY